MQSKKKRGCAAWRPASEEGEIEIKKNVKGVRKKEKKKKKRLDWGSETN